MNRPLVSVSLSMLMLTSLLCIIPPMALADEPGEIVEPICNANRNDTWTVGLIYCDDRVNEDYTLFAPMSSDTTYLIDAHGRMVHSWTSPSGLPPGMSAYMLEDGDLLRTVSLGINFDHDGNGVAGKIERLSWDGQMEWEWFYPGETNRSHHDIEPLPNGNFLMIAWDFKSEAEAQQAGRNPNKMSQDTLWPDQIVEVQPVGTDQANIVWEWNIWDHLIQDFDSTKDNYGVVGDHPELLDINFVDSPDTLSPYKSDWMHCNGIDYNPILDQIVLSCRNVNEIYIIDHSTTTEEAAGHTGGNSGKGGDILYRWGNPEAYRAGTNNDQQLFGQHDIQWINEGRLGAGDLIVFNNGHGRDYSSADVISPPLVNGEYVLQSGSSWGPTAPSWSWDQGTSMFASSLGGVERLENGNTLVTWGVRGTLFEVNPEGEVVWKYINPVIGDGPLNQGDDIPENSNGKSNENKVFKTHRYNSSFPGFVGKDLTPGDYVEFWTDDCSNEESIPWDSDGDGCIDDSDGDGVGDNVDLCSGFDDNIDTDGDGIPDGCDSPIDAGTEPICNANRNGTWTVGLIYCDDRADEDYTLFAPISSASTYLIDTHGRMVHSWTSSSNLRPGLSAYMLEDGDLLRTANIGTDGGGSFSGGGIAGKIERLSWDSQMEWEWFYVGDSRRSHHDIEPLPNGNFLMIAWEAKSVEQSEQAGRDPDKMSQNQLWPDHIVEVEPSGSDQGTVVWEWHIWDHLIQDFDSTMDNYGVVADHPELLDINFADASGPNKYRSDWMHCNGIDYNPILDQIALSCKNTNEIYIIDHSTTTEEAASHSGGNFGKGGDILYRWGNPEAYRAGTPEDQQLFAQHDVQWIKEGRPGAGDLTLFNNGVGRSTSYSSVDVISPPLINGEYVIQPGSAWGPAAPNWTWDQGTDMYGTSISGAERLANGNTLVTWGQRGTFYEVNLEGEIVWEYINPVVGNGPMNQGETIPQGQNPNSQQNTVFKAHRYNSSFPGFVGKDLTPGDYIESWTDNCDKEESIPWDSDGDGCIDDTDGDGVKDNADICRGFDDNVDVDGDSVPDGCDDLVDSDEDGVADSEDLCPGFDDTIDVDADGIPDDCDDLLDTDGDGISDEGDTCPGFDDNIDVDADGIADGCDDLIDIDADGIADGSDTCPGHDDSIDVDADGVPDGCDALIDSDGDEISDTNDTCDGHDDAIDVDADGIADGCDSLIDSDMDGVADSEDLCAGYNDTIDQDGDGIPDDCDQTPMPVENQTNTTDDSSLDENPGNSAAHDSDSSGSQMTYAVVFAILGLLIVFIAAARLLFMRPTKEEIGWNSAPPLDVFDSPVPEHYPPEPAADLSQGPPLPASGLPAGWTMEQWQNYGQQYLDELAGHNNG